MPTDRRKATSEDLRDEVLAKIKQYEEKGFVEAGRIHEIIMQANPSLCPRLWYGMPGYARTKDSAVLCFFRKDDLISFGITESANLDEQGSGSYVASSWYIKELDKQSEDLISRTVASATK